MPNQNRSPTVAIIGGGLAGVAAAVALRVRNWQVDLFESRRHLGGRAGSFQNPQSNEMIDHCQHVSMGCCTNLHDLCRRTQIENLFRRDKEITFYTGNSRPSVVRATSWLPAPLHLAPSLLTLSHLTWNDRWSIATSLWRLARTPASTQLQDLTFGQWLRTQGQSDRAIDGFWSVILVSALAEQIDRVSYSSARKVFVDGFMASTSAYELHVPQTSLGEIYGIRVAQWLSQRGVNIRLQTPVDQLDVEQDRMAQLQCLGAKMSFDYFIVALPWQRLHDLINPDTISRIPCLKHLDQFRSSPITAVHLWFDRPIMDVLHAVIVGRLSQWIFSHDSRKKNKKEALSEYYYQVVISASENLTGRGREKIVQQVRADLASIWPVAGLANLVASRIVTQHDAVFTIPARYESVRPSQQTTISNLALAGDWTQTGWPATMESAVRSGYLAAEVILDAHGQPAQILVDDLPKGWLAQRVIRDR